MAAASGKKVTVSATVKAPIGKVWKSWTMPEHITKWNQASDDWHSPRADNDVRLNGKFTIRMEAKDGSAGFDFEGTYDAVEEHRKLAYTLSDGRTVEVLFTPAGDSIRIDESFEAESKNPVEMQRTGWQAILDSFKRYTESLT